jgi:exopolysaccharide biosynthesis protein
MAGRIHKRETTPLVLLFLIVGLLVLPLAAQQTTERPFRGVVHITRQLTIPRAVTLHIVTIDLTDPGVHLKLTAPGGPRETVRETTLAFMNRERAQIAINGHFFLPFPSTDLNADVIGLAASEGNLYSSCELPAQSYAIVANAPAINFDRLNRASIVRCSDGTSALWNALAGSAQIITNGVVTIPVYRDQQNPEGQLTPSAEYSNQRSWYDLPRARTAIGLTRNVQLLVLLAVEAGRNAETSGMTVGEVARLLLRDYAVYNAINLDGGGSTSLAIDGRLVTSGSREVASSLAIFAERARR